MPFRAKSLKCKKLYISKIQNGKIANSTKRAKMGQRLTIFKGGL